jgi:LacI family transcriptional regulator
MAPARRITIRDVAREAGVSIATVSRVMNRRADVSPATRDRVLAVVGKHGFSVNQSARALSNGRTGLVAMTVPVLDEYFAKILTGASEALYEQDIRVVLCPTQHEVEREARVLERLIGGMVDGAILILPSEPGAELRKLAQKGYPFVIVDDREALDPSIPAVSASHAAGARDATLHLLRLGHRRIAAITGPRGWVADEERLNGYHAALASVGVMPDAQLEIEADFQREGGYRSTLQLLALPEPPTAIFAFNDNLAMGALRAATDSGLTLPDDLSIIGFDDLEQAAYTTPTLTTVRQPLAEMGRMAVSLLLRQLEGNRVETLRVELATQLVVRGSTAPPASS